MPRLRIAIIADDYQGFDVAESKRRSEEWMALSHVDRSRIGRKSFWENQVVPRLHPALPQTNGDLERTESFNGSPSSEDSGRWLRSEQARKSLGVSTCELMHLREAGKITFKKEGRVFVYWVEEEGEV